MKLHVIVDPHGKVDNRLPEYTTEKYSIRCAAVEIHKGLDYSQREQILASLIRVMLTEPEHP